uniref:BHLH domain-containing protein n=1 Tax=Opuntia streptacantha TaxID=393608 RepID=A0A7C9FN83_OPUST
MASFDGSAWDLALDYSCFIDDAASADFSWVNHSSSFDIDFSQTSCAPQEQESSLKEPPRKRGRADGCSKTGTKACRERLRREKLNDSFVDLSTILEPGRAAKTDKLAILTDAVRVVNRLRTEAKEYKEQNKKLQEEIDSLKAEKNELREEKQMLKAEKEMMEQQLKAMAVPTSGLMPSYPAAYHAAANKMAVYPSYGMFPMWHYLPPSTRDTSRDHELRPPAA